MRGARGRSPTLFKTLNNFIYFQEGSPVNFFRVLPLGYKRVADNLYRVTRIVKDKKRVGQDEKKVVDINVPFRDIRQIFNIPHYIVAKVPYRAPEKSRHRGNRGAPETLHVVSDDREGIALFYRRFLSL